MEAMKEHMTMMMETMMNMNKMIKKLCEDFKIQHHNLIPYWPNMNAAVEDANKNIKKIIQKMSDIQRLARDVVVCIAWLLNFCAYFY